MANILFDILSSALTGFIDLFPPLNLISTPLNWLLFFFTRA